MFSTVTGLLFPVLTFPYVSRIIMAEGIGEVQFYSSIINYIALLTCLGIPTYAIREISRIRDDQKLLVKTSMEILSLHTILSIFGYVIVLIMCFSIERVIQNIPMFLLLSITIFLNTIGCEWLYKAVEDFKYITIRGLIIRILAVVFLFLFVKDKEDIMLYAFYTLIVSVGNNIFNFFHLREVVDFRLFSFTGFNPLRHLPPALHIFILNLTVSIYVNLDTVMLGFMKGNEAVGFYSAGNKLPHIMLTLVTSLGTVALPRCANLISKGDKDGFVRIGKKAIQFVIAVSLPCTIGLIMIAPEFIRVFCGTEFLPSIPVLQWTAAIILFIGLSNVTGIQMLYPLGKENIVIWSTVGGAVINLLFNVFLIPVYAYVGASIATFMAEFTVLIIQIWIGRKYIPFNLFSVKIGKYIIATVAMCVILFALRLGDLGTVGYLSCAIGAGVFSYGIMLIILREPLCREFLAFIKLRTDKYSNE